MGLTTFCKSSLTRLKKVGGGGWVLGKVPQEVQALAGKVHGEVQALAGEGTSGGASTSWGRYLERYKH